MALDTSISSYEGSPNEIRCFDCGIDLENPSGQICAVCNRKYCSTCMSDHSKDEHHQQMAKVVNYGQ